MKKTKSILIFVLSALLTLSLAIFAACGGGTTSGSESCKHEHTEDTTDIKATCTADGRKLVKCTDCGNTIASEIIEKTGHKYLAGFCSNCGGEDPDHTNFYVNALDSDAIKTVNVSGRDIDLSLLSDSPDENGNVVSPKQLNVKVAVENCTFGATSTDKEYFANIGIEAEGLTSLTASLLVNETLARATVDKDGIVTNVRVDKNFIEELIKANTGITPQDFDSAQIKQYIDLAFSQLGSSKNKVLYNLSKYFFSAEEKTNEVVFTLDYNAVKKLNVNLADMTGKGFVDDLIGENTFQTLSQAILSAISKPQLGLSEEEQTRITSIVNSLETKSVYAVFATDDETSADDIKNSVNDFIDKIKNSLSVEIISGKDGKIKSVSVTVKNFDVTDIARILYPKENIITAIIMSGTITLTPSTVSVSDGYADKISELKTATDIGDKTSTENDYTYTSSADKTAQASDSDNSTATPITTHYKIENGNVVSVKTVYKVGEEYFSIECNKPLLVCFMTSNVSAGDQSQVIKTVSVMQFATAPTDATDASGKNSDLSANGIAMGEIKIGKATLGENGKFVDGEELKSIPVSRTALKSLQFVSFTL